jgi:hypothetical protein
MYSKLTLSIDEKVIENAKKYARDQKRSVSKLVEEYLSSISFVADAKVEYNALGPITKDLVGIIKVRENTNYKDILTGALMEKYVGRKEFSLTMTSFWIFPLKGMNYCRMM